MKKNIGVIEERCCEQPLIGKAAWQPMPVYCRCRPCSGAATRLAGGHPTFPTNEYYCFGVEMLKDNTEISGATSAVEEAQRNSREEGLPPFSHQIPLTDFHWPKIPVSPAAHAASRSISIKTIPQPIQHYSEDITALLGSAMRRMASINI